MNQDKRRDQIISISTRLESARITVRQLETELDQLIGSSVHVTRGVTLKGKPNRNKVNILKILRASDHPMKLSEVHKKCGMSHSGTQVILSQLLKEGHVEKPSYGHYTIKSS